MRSLFRVFFLAVAALVLASLAGSQARAPAKRQYYDSKWSYKKASADKPKSGGYYYKQYHYKPTPSYKGYKQQYVVYKPQQDKNYVYWYNPAPEKKVYWARCPTKNHPTYGKQVKAGKDYWSLAKNKKNSLNDVKNNDFGEVTQNAPPIPESKDNAKIACPPSDLPPDDLPED
jgi:hypothetical protein